MSLWVCDPDRGGCTTRYSVDAPACPHCGQTAAYELGDEQRRNVRDLGEQEGDAPSAGTSSSTSSGKPSRGEMTSDPGRPRRARMTASPSKPDPTANSTVDSTAISGKEVSQ